MRRIHPIEKDVRGITLIELLVVIAMLGIILVVAVPSFGGYMIKAKRQDATTLLYETVQRLERCFTLEGVYNGACSVKSTSEEGYYTLSTVRTEQSYILSAIPVSGKSQSGDSDCATFSITSTGEKDATGPMGKRCWQ